MRVLSIDFDYFIDTNIDTRNNVFPDGYDEIPKDELKDLWNEVYIENPSVSEIGVTKEYYDLLDYLKTHKGSRILVCDSHKDIEMLFRTNEPIEELVHVDFHHDNYCTGSSLTCANWVRFFKEQYEEAKLTWVHREDSEIMSLFGEFPYDRTTNFNDFVQGDFDYIFICLSPEWTPPHLVPNFWTLVHNL